MKKLLLSLLNLALAMSLATTARAQIDIFQAYQTSRDIGRLANRKPSIRPTTVYYYRDQRLWVQRTADFQLPKLGSEFITTLEAQLDRCYGVMMTDSTAIICSPAQHEALQNAIANLARAHMRWDVHAYQQEANFYFAEDNRRQTVPR